MPNPQPVQSDQFLKKRFQRVTKANSCIPSDVPLATKVISVKLPVSVDRAVRNLDKQKAAWLREVISQAALDQGLVEIIE